MKKKNVFFPIVVTVIILFAGGSIIFLINQQWSERSINIKSTLANQVTDQQDTKDLKAIIHEAQKNVVQIETTTKMNEQLGSGFIFNDKGDIVTNAHVVKDAESIYVKTANARTYTAALVGIGTEEDIAVIRVPQLANQTPAVINEDFHAELGDEIIAVGSPLGFQNSVTLGIISGTNRSFSIDEYDYNDVYQISANITHGNSGGPLIDRHTGRVIGVNSAGIGDSSIGFSIPIGIVLDTITTWSDQADNQNLTYDSLVNNSQFDNPEQLKEDAGYIVGYFFDSLAIRDYINAYTLFGSDWQTKTSYQDFRENYIHVIETDISNIESSFIEEDEQVKVSLTADKLIKGDDQTTINEVYEYIFHIGFENGQLKLLDGKRTLISSSPNETELKDE